MKRTEWTILYTYLGVLDISSNSFIPIWAFGFTILNVIFLHCPVQLYPCTDQWNIPTPLAPVTIRGAIYFIQHTLICTSCTPEDRGCVPWIKVVHRIHHFLTCDCINWTSIRLTPRILGLTNLNSNFGPCAIFSESLVESPRPQSATTCLNSMKRCRCRVLLKTHPW